MKLSLADIKNFLEGTLNQYRSLPDHQREQAEMRAFLCQPCLQKGKCTHCGCKTPAMFLSPSKEDSEQKWGKFLDETQWTALKNNITQYHEYLSTLNEKL